MPFKGSRRVAIIGAGYAGLATAWYLLNLQKSFEITFFDPSGYGGQASRVSAGLVHKYSGLHSKLNRFGKEAEAESHLLFDIAERFSDQPIILNQGILRLALDSKQELNFQNCADRYDDVEWLSIEKCQNLDPLLPSFPGILIKSGLSIDTANYLKGLYLACVEKGARLVPEKVCDLKSLSSFDIKIVTVGAASSQFPELSLLKVHPVKGQIIELAWPKNLPSLPLSLIGQVYLCMNRDKSAVVVGATYEHQFSDANPEPQKAIGELFPKARQIYPSLEKANVITTKSALRASIPSRIPFIGQVGENLWAFTGLGSRGLLYHAYFAKQLAHLI